MKFNNFIENEQLEIKEQIKDILNSVRIKTTCVVDTCDGFYRLEGYTQLLGKVTSLIFVCDKNPAKHRIGVLANNCEKYFNGVLLSN